MKNNLQIFVCYHKPYFICKNDFMCSVQGGRDIAETEDKDGKRNKKDRQWLLENTIGDNTGDNISLLNRNFNEMTVQYWVWKNYEKIGNYDYVGFMQYRRQFILNPEFDNIKRSDWDVAYSMFKVNRPNDKYFDIIRLNEKNIKNILKKYDVILPKKSDLSLVGRKSMREDYEKSIPGVNVKDFDNFVKYIKKIHPKFGKYFEQKTKEPTKHLYLSFITSKKIFMEYASFVFPILLEFNKTLDVSDYSVNGKRTIGYLSETLYGIYFDYMKDTKGYKLKEVDVTMIQDEGLPDGSIIKLLLTFWKYFVISKLTFGDLRKKYKQKRQAIKNKFKNYGPMKINDKKVK